MGRQRSAKSARKFLLRGTLVGFLVIDIQFELYDDRSQAVDSVAMSLQVAGKRRRLTGMETFEGMQRIRAQVPLATTPEYNNHLRSITAGEGTFTMTLGHYEAVPPHIQAEIVRARKATFEEHLVANH